ncbi:hypothetical protein CYMTET_27474 [Cymbomonas tetramitiformis]|uniref:peptidylprolyl isomerase n=1 Tax=Cymbomonas tetramitiformis TaxID=36881 RepID=A0AAE0FQB0_9CHLO|nr:hypothetical protein CYMTET_27474 [Cymbomonas tetramitiformis]
MANKLQCCRITAPGAYSKASFYRADKDYVLQGGLYPKANPKYGKDKIPIPLEYVLPNKKGTITMARWEDLTSGDGEFFINMRDNPNLDRTGSSGWQAGFTVFGEVISGMEVAKNINHQGPLSSVKNIPFSLSVVEPEL